MSKQPYLFHEGANVAWDLVVWPGEFERVVVAVLSREHIAQLREHFDRGDDAWMYDIYRVPKTLLPVIADLLPEAPLDPTAEHFVEARPLRASCPARCRQGRRDLKSRQPRRRSDLMPRQDSNLRHPL
jgi:hypothetical protein